MSTPNPPNPPAAYCRHCGKPLSEEEKRDVRGMIFCEDCLAGVVGGAFRTPPLPYAAAPRPASPGLAAFLGIIPGVGAMYNGQFAKGFLHVVITATLISLLDHGVAPVLFAFLLVAFWWYMLIDAYQTARARTLGLPLPDPFGLNSLLGVYGGSVVSGSAAPSGTAQAMPYAATPPPPPACAPEEPARDRQPIGAFILIALGIFFLLRRFEPVQHFIQEFFWPLFLIGLGVWLAIRRLNLTGGFASPANHEDAADESASETNPSKTQ